MKELIKIMLLAKLMELCQMAKQAEMGTLAALMGIAGSASHLDEAAQMDLLRVNALWLQKNSTKFAEEVARMKEMTGIDVVQSDLPQSIKDFMEELGK